MDPWDDLIRDSMKVSARDLLATERALAVFQEQLRRRKQRTLQIFSATAACFALVGGAWLYQWHTAPLPHTVAYEAYTQVNGAW